MEISPYFLTLLVIYSFLFGAVVGVLNDFHRLTRILFGVRYSKKRFERLYTARLPLLGRSVGEIGAGKIKKITLPVMIFLQDVLLFVFSAVGVAVLNYYFNYGQFRIYTIAAMLLGFAIYYFTVGKLVMLFSEGIVCLARIALTMLFFLLSRPFVLLGQMLRGIIRKITDKIREAIANRRKKLYNIHMIDRMMREAASGFLSGSEVDQEIKRIKEEKRKSEDGHGTEELL